MSHAAELTDSTVQAFIESKEKPVLICFYSSEEDAQWQFDEVIEELAQCQSNVEIGKIDSWKYPEPARYYNAKWFPTSIIFDHGEIKDYVVGEDYADAVMERLAPFFK